MNPIFQGLEQGYSPEDILGYLSKVIPQIVPSIKKATKAGYNVQQILGFLSKKMPFDVHQGMSESEIHSVNRRNDSERTKWGLSLATAAVAAPIAGRVVGNAISRALPSSLQGVVGGANQQNPVANNSTNPDASNPLQSASAPTSQIGQPQNQVISSQQPPVSSKIPQTTNITQAEQKTINTEEILNNHNLTKQVNNLLSNKATPDQISGYFEKFSPKEVKKIEKETGLSFKQIVDEHAKKSSENLQKSTESIENLPEIAINSQNQAKISPKNQIGEDFNKAFETLEGSSTKQLYEGIFNALKEGKDTFSGVKDPLLQAAKPAFDAGQITAVDDLKKFAKFYEESKKQPKIEKNALVSSPQGVGEVKAIRNGQAIIDIDGKQHKVKEEELSQLPIKEKDLADLWEDVIGGIEKETGQEVSRHVNIAAYNPKTNSLLYLPHGGERVYQYENISPEDVEELTNILAVRKTTGENFIGGWGEGTKSPIGSRMSALIQKQKAKAKAREESEKKQMRFSFAEEKQKEKAPGYEIVYSALEPAERAKKEKYQREKAKKARKK